MYGKITSRCVIWNAQFKWWFEWLYFGPCVRQITSRIVIWNARFVIWQMMVRTIIWIAHFKLRIAMWFWRTHGPNYHLSNFNSKCAFRIQIQITHFAVVWKQSKLILKHIFDPKMLTIHVFAKHWAVESKVTCKYVTSVCVFVQTMAHHMTTYLHMSHTHFFFLLLLLVLILCISIHLYVFKG